MGWRVTLVSLLSNVFFFTLEERRIKLLIIVMNSDVLIHNKKNLFNFFVYKYNFFTSNICWSWWVFIVREQQRRRVEEVCNPSFIICKKISCSTKIVCVSSSIKNGNAPCVRSVRIKRRKRVGSLIVIHQLITECQPKLWWSSLLLPRVSR